MQVTAYGIIAQNCQTGELSTGQQFFPPGGADNSSQNPVSLTPAARVFVLLNN